MQLQPAGNAEVAPGVWWSLPEVVGSVVLHVYFSLVLGRLLVVAFYLFRIVFLVDIYFFHCECVLIFYFRYMG